MKIPNVCCLISNHSVLYILIFSLSSISAQHLAGPPGTSATSAKCHLWYEALWFSMTAEQLRPQRHKGHMVSWQVLAPGTGFTAAGHTAEPDRRFFSRRIHPQFSFLSLPFLLSVLPIMYIIPKSAVTPIKFSHLYCKQKYN